MKEIYFAGGCFWGTEHFFKQIRGVLETEAGYANGNTEQQPSYEEVCTETTGYAETVHVKYDEKIVSLEFLLTLYFKTIDPTSINRQGYDVGTRYRTGVYYTDEEDLSVIQKVFVRQQGMIELPLAVESKPLQNFFPAEEYHQDYLDKHPRGYCHIPFQLFRYAKEARMDKEDMI